MNSGFCVIYVSSEEAPSHYVEVKFPDEVKFTMDGDVEAGTFDVSLAWRWKLLEIFLGVKIAPGKLSFFAGIIIEECTINEFFDSLGEVGGTHTGWCGD